MLTVDFISMQREYHPYGCLGCGLPLGVVLLGLFITTAGGSKEPDREGLLVLLLLLLLVALAIFGSGRKQESAGVWKCESCGQANEEELEACMGCGKDRA